MAEKIKWEASFFDTLDIHSLYKICKLRSDVFIVEQNCAYPDIDGKDYKALHLQGYIGNELVAYCRLFRAGDYFEQASIGRVIIATAYREHKYGHLLMQKAIELQLNLLKENNIHISAQAHLKNFYAKHGFVQVGDSYLEDGIPHIGMIRNVATL